MSFNWKNNSAVVSNPLRADPVLLDRFDKHRHSIFGRNVKLDAVMIIVREGKTDDNVTGLPPKFKQEDRDRWAARREMMEIERLFRS
jgi:hypothetical protein